MTLLKVQGFDGKNKDKMLLVKNKKIIARQCLENYKLNELNLWRMAIPHQT